MANMISLQEASSFLGVSRATLRNWDNDGKLTAIRNPVNGYRMYNFEEILNLKQAIEGNAYFPIQTPDTMVDSKTVKRMISKLHNIIRDGDANSNIIGRFDEISKLLFIKLYAEQQNENIYALLTNETADIYAQRIQSSYSLAIESAGIHVPFPYNTIQLTPDLIMRCGAELSKINTSYANVDIKGLAYEDMIKGTFDKSDNQQYFTPYQIVSFMVDMMSDYIYGTVCDPACGTAGFLTTVGNEFDVKLLGLEVDDRLAWVSTLNLLIHGKNSFEVHSFQNGGSLGKEAHKYYNTVDAILTNPPFGSDYSDESLLSLFDLGKDKSSRRRGILFIEQAWKLLKPNGVVAIIIDQGVLNAGSNADVRDYILNHFSILAIVDLPESAFLPYASVSSSILFLQKSARPNNTRVFYAKSNLIGRKSNGDDDYNYLADGSAVLNSDLPEILKQWKLFKTGISKLNTPCYVADLSDPPAFVESNRLDYVYHHPFRKESAYLIAQSKYPLLTLSELCVERNESYIPATDTETTTILFTGLANIESFSGKLIQVVTPTASIKSSVKRYEPDDILFSKMRPALRKVAVAHFQEGGFVSSECAVLSVRKNSSGEDMINPYLLSTILRSDYVYGQIMGYVTGIGRPRINMKDLRKVKIPVPPKEIQSNALAVLKMAQTTSTQLKEKATLLFDEANTIEKNAINKVAQLMTGEINEQRRTI